MAIHRDAASFRRRMEQLARQVEDRADELVRDTVDRTAREAIDATPSDSGYMKGNWDVVPPGETPATRGDRTALEGSKSEGQTRARADAAKVAAGLEADRLRAGDYVDVANATPYGRVVDEGSSTSAPAGITRGVAASIRAWLRTRRILTQRHS